MSVFLSVCLSICLSLSSLCCFSFSCLVFRFIQAFPNFAAIKDKKGIKQQDPNKKTGKSSLPISKSTSGSMPTTAFRNQSAQQRPTVGTRQPASAVVGERHSVGGTPSMSTHPNQLSQGYPTRAALPTAGTAQVGGTQVLSAQTAPTTSVNQVMLVPVQQPGSVMYMSPNYMYAPMPQTLLTYPLQQSYTPMAPAQSPVVLPPSHAFTQVQSTGQILQQPQVTGMTDTRQTATRSTGAGTNTVTMFTTLPQHLGQTAVQNAEANRQKQKMQATRTVPSSGGKLVDGQTY